MLKRPNGTGIFYVDVTLEDGLYTAQSNYAAARTALDNGALLVVRVSSPGSSTKYGVIDRVFDTGLVFNYDGVKMGFANDGAIAVE